MRIAYLDVLINKVEEDFINCDISETTARIAIVMLLATKRNFEDCTNTTPIDLNSREVMEILYRRIPKEKWPKCD